MKLNLVHNELFLNEEFKTYAHPQMSYPLEGQEHPMTSRYHIEP